MEKENPPVHQLNRPEGTGDASQDLHHRGVGESASRRQEEQIDPFASPETWEVRTDSEVQWQEFLERLRSLEVLQEAALW